MKFRLSALFVAFGLARIIAAEPFVGSPLGAAVAAARAEIDARDVTQGNRVAIITGGYDALLLRVHLIRQARSSIAIQTFIWTNDECGRLLMCELIEAARRGVKVRIIADHLVSEQDPATAAFLATADPNLEIRHYRPALSRMKPTLLHQLVATLRSFHDVNQRMHNKVMIVDGAVLVTGGRNIENTYYDHSTVMNFRDRDVLAVGPIVATAAESFERFWAYKYSVASRDLTDVAAVMAAGTFRRYDRREDFGFGTYFRDLTREADDPAVIEARFAARLRPVRKAEFLSDEPGKLGGVWSRRPEIAKQLGRTLEQAKTSVVMQTPYLVLSSRARKLVRELKAGNPALRVRISTNSFASTDNLLAYSANYRLRNDYVQDLGLEVHEFKPEPASRPQLFPQYPVIADLARTKVAAGEQARMPFMSLHAKSLVVDDRVAFIGSYNLDPRSERLNTEVGLLVEDEAFARELRDEIERDMRAGNSWVVARRVLPLHLESLNVLVGGILSLSPVDLWPIQNTSCFDLRPGATEVPPGDPAFYRNYREAGAFPGTEGLFTTKEILTRLYKVVGTPLTPVI